MVLRGLFFLLLSLPGLSHATSEILTLIDVDNNLATGCTVNTVDGTVDGIDFLSTTVVTTGIVTDVSLSECNASIFDAPVSISAGGWPVGDGIGVAGADLIETFIPLSRLQITVPREVRVAFSAQNDGGPSVDALLTSGGNDVLVAISAAIPPTNVPSLSDLAVVLLVMLLLVIAFFTLRKRTELMLAVILVIGLGALTTSKRSIAFDALDGLISSWGATPDAIDPAEGGAPDITATFFAEFNNDLRIRIDGDFLEAAPQVESTLPVDNAVGIALNGNLQITFDEPVNVAGDWIKIACSKSGAYDPSGVGTLLAISGGPTLFTVNPASDFVLGDICDVTIDQTLVTDQDAIDPPDTMAADYLFSFSVLDAAPEVVSTVPADTATDVLVNSTVTINFDENVNVAAGGMTLNCGAPVSFTGLPASDTNSVVITPNSNLPFNTLCTLTVVATGVTDADVQDPPDNMAANTVVTFTTDKLPEVTTTVPANTATGIATDTNITINFDENVNVGAAGVTLECPVASAQAFAGLPATNVNSIVINPTANLPSDQICTVTVVASEVTDTSTPANSMAANHVFTFQFDSAPGFTSSVPADSATSVGLGSNIVITFDEAVNAVVGDFGLTCTPGGAQTFGLSGSGTATLTLNPTVNLPSAASCTTTIATTITDVDAIDPPDNYSGISSFGFATEVDAPPKVNSVTPASGATAVAADANISLTFSELVTTTGAWAQVVCGAQTQTVGTDIAVSGTDPNFILNPDVDFPSGASCTLTVFSNAANGVTDDDAVDPPNLLDGDGNGSEGPNFTSSFSIADAAPELNAAAVEKSNVFTDITGTYPGSGLNAVDADSNLRLTFSEAINGTGNWFTINCPASGLRNPADTVIIDADPVFTINPNANFTPGETCRLTVVAAQIDDDDANDPPANLAANQSFDFEIKPAAADDSYTATTHLEITVINTSGVLANDNNVTSPATSGISGFGATLGTANGTVANGTNEVTTSNGGTVKLSANGSFVYNPPAAFTGADSFFYTLTSTNGGSDTAEATITVAGPLVWFIDSSAGSPGDGTARKPFQSLVGGANSFDANASDAVGHFIFIDNGGNNYTCGLTLLNNQTLIGDGDASTIQAIASMTPDVRTTSGLIPTISGTDPTLTSGAAHCINLASGNSIRGLTIGNTANTHFGIRGTVAGTFNINDVSINGTGGALEITTSGTAGTVAFNELSSSSSSSHAIALNNIGGSSMTATTGTITGSTGTAVEITNGAPALTYPGSVTKNSAGRLIDITGTSGANLTFSGALAQSSAAGTGINVANNTGGGLIAFSNASKTLNTATNAAISLNTNTGSTVNFSGGGLDIDTTTGTGFNATGGGAVTVSGAGNSVLGTRTAVNVNGTIIGAAGMAFQRIDVDAANAANKAVILANTGSGAFTVNGVGSTDGTGGTIENIQNSDAITFENTGGLITFKNMIIEDISHASDGSDAIGTRRDVDGIHGHNVNAGLVLDNVIIRRISDNAIHGATFANGTTSWAGLTITNDSLIEDSNRYHVAGRGDDSSEGMVRILGLQGTVLVQDSTFRRGSELLDFTTATTGNLDLTIQNNTFNDSMKEFGSGGTVNIGKACVGVTKEGSGNAVIRIGDPAEASAALGNDFTNCATASVSILQADSSTGNVSTVISRNDFVINDHTTAQAAPGNLLFNFPQGGVLLGTGGGLYEAIVSNNLFDEVMHAGGGLGQLTLVMDSTGQSEFDISGNNFQLPWDAPVRVLADGNSGKGVVRFDSNTYTDGMVGSAADDVGFATQSPFTPFHVNVRNGGVLDMTVANEVLPQHDATSGFVRSFDASMNSSGGTLNLNIDSSASPAGYNFDKGAATGTFNLYTTGGCPATINAIIDGNGNTGGGGSDLTDPPTTSAIGGGAGTIGCTTTLPTVPNIVIP